MRKELYSKRNIVIFIMIVVLIPINLCCIIFSNIPYSTEIKNLKNFEDLKWFETITFALNSYLISAVYTLLIYGIPIEICRKYMLTNNRKAYAMMCCTLTGGRSLF